MLNSQEGRVSVPINKRDRSHTAGLDDKLIAAGLLPMNYQYHQLEEFLDRLRGTNHEPMMVVRHPRPDNDSSAGVIREHKIDEAIALLADPNGPEAQLRERRRRELERFAEEDARKAEEQRRQEAVRRQDRWSAMTETQRALWLVAARTRPRIASDYGQVTHRQLGEILEKQQMQFLEALSLALADAHAPEVPDDVTNAPHFAE